MESKNAVRDMITKHSMFISKEVKGVLLSMATGVGKTLIAIMCYEQYFKETQKRGYLVIKETNHEGVWRDEFKKWGKEELLEHLDIFCYASLHKYANTTTGFIILDECHALSEGREDKLESIAFDKMVSLSATVGKEVKQRLRDLVPKGQFEEYHISLQEAIDMGLIPSPKIYTNYVELDEDERKLPWTKKDPRLFSEREYYQKISKRVVYWQNQYMQSAEGWQERKWMISALERKKFMASCKTNRAKEMLKYLHGKRFICFTGGIEQCAELGVSQAIHSKIHKKDREKLINEFNEGKTSELYAVGMLRESMNLEGIEAGIIVQLDNQQGTTEQIIGRVLRSLAPEVYILLCRDTKDEDYFTKATKGIDPSSIEEFILP